VPLACPWTRWLTLSHAAVRPPDRARALRGPGWRWAGLLGGSRSRCQGEAVLAPHDGACSKRCSLTEQGDYQIPSPRCDAERHPDGRRPTCGHALGSWTSSAACARGPRAVGAHRPEGTGRVHSSVPAPSIATRAEWDASDPSSPQVVRLVEVVDVSVDPRATAHTPLRSTTLSHQVERLSRSIRRRRNGAGQQPTGT
jgi:hypothetical protein